MICMIGNAFTKCITSSQVPIRHETDGETNDSTLLADHFPP